MPANEELCVINIPTAKMRSAVIRSLNDELRAGRGKGKLYITAGVINLNRDGWIEVMQRVANFDAFTPDNDPHDEHDFGGFEWEGETIFWKIEYYDTELHMGADDPADAENTNRVLTVMLAGEY